MWWRGGTRGKLQAPAISEVRGTLQASFTSAAARAQGALCTASAEPFWFGARVIMKEGVYLAIWSPNLGGASSQFGDFICVHFINQTAKGADACSLIVPSALQPASMAAH